MTLQDIAKKEEQRFILFGGKGGVGKTSCASAAAIWFADNGKKTLIISTDPAHSLSDSLQVDLSGGEIIEVAGVENLYGLEINPRKAMENYEQVVEQASGESKTPLAASPFGDLLQNPGTMAYPGMDEALAFTKVLEFMNSDEYDIVVFDTAPTGHTLRLLSLPELMDSFLGKIIKLQYSLKKMLGGFKRLLGRGGPNDNALEALEKQKEAIEEAKAVLSDNKQTTFIPVLIPEAMAISETERLLTSLQEYEIPVSHLVINQLIPEDKLCDFCSARRKMQQKHLLEIRDIYDDFILTEIPLYESEINGIPLLRDLSKILFN